MRKTFVLILLTLCVLLFSCVPNGNDPTEPTIPEGLDCLKDVIFLDETVVDSVSILNDTTITMYSSYALNDTLKSGRKFVYSHSKTADVFCLGIVKNVDVSANTFMVHTSIPSFDEIFKELSLTPELNSTNLKVDFEADDADDVIFKGLVDNSIWNEIETIYQEDTTEVSSSPRRSSAKVPIDITLSFEVKPNQAFTGTIYLRLKGTLQIHDCKAYEMDVQQTVGIQGSFGIAEVSTGRKYIPLLQIKNGMTLYSNKVVGIRIKPCLNFFYGGGIKLEAGFKYEMINANVRSVFDGNNFKQFTSENQKDYYFRVKSLHSEGEFGLSLSNDLYAFVFTDNFFSAGVKAEAGLSVSGEKNVGIQFPDIANFDFSVMFTPFLEFTPFATIRTPKLKRFEGPAFKANTEAYSVDLLPNVHNINYEKKNKKLKVSASVYGENTSFIAAKETGMALFKKGENSPVAYRPIITSASSVARRIAAENDLEFDMEDNAEYEIAKYSKTETGEDAFGEKIPIDDGHPHAIDLGLSVKWACCNLGASKPEDFGDYFSWGETAPKEVYCFNYYKWGYADEDGFGFEELYKYNTDPSRGIVDNKIELDIEDDAAHVNWGGNWRMPTLSEWEELIEYCTFTQTTLNGVKGVQIKGINGNIIFLPEAGIYNVTTLIGCAVQAFYLSSSLYTDRPTSAYCFTNEYSVEQDFIPMLKPFNRGMHGFTIRAVCP